MKNIKLKIITGFRKDEAVTIDADEAEKAYKLFLNPDHRAIFKNGFALVGKDIRRIEPDYHATMGWNKYHNIDGDDWNEIKRNGLEKKMQSILFEAKQKQLTE